MLFWQGLSVKIGSCDYLCDLKVCEIKFIKLGASGGILFSWNEIFFKKTFLNFKIKYTQINNHTLQLNSI